MLKIFKKLLWLKTIFRCHFFCCTEIFMSWLNYFVIAGNKQIEINNFICLFYTVGEGSHSEDRYVDQDDQLLQFAIQQSLLDSECSSEPSQPLNLVEALDTFSKENSSPHPPRNTSIGRYGGLFLQWQILHKKKLFHCTKNA